MSSLVETVTALDSETQASRETIFAPGVHNAATIWYNDGVMASNVTESGVLAQIVRDALRSETARIDGRGNVSWMRYDAFGCVAATLGALTNATAYAYDEAGRRIVRIPRDRERVKIRMRLTRWQPILP